MRLFIMITLTFVFCGCNNSRFDPDNNKSKETKILEDEIEDVSLIGQVTKGRNLVRQYLDETKAKSLGLKDTYMHEAPYSIVYVKDEDIICYDAMAVKAEDYATYLNLFHTVSNKNLPSKETSIEGYQVYYISSESYGRFFVQAVVASDKHKEQIFFKVSTPVKVDAQSLLEKNFLVNDSY